MWRHVVGAVTVAKPYLLFSDKTKNGVHCDRYLCNSIKKSTRKLDQRWRFAFFSCPVYNIILLPGFFCSPFYFQMLFVHLLMICFLSVLFKININKHHHLLSSANNNHQSIKSVKPLSTFLQKIIYNNIHNNSILWTILKDNPLIIDIFLGRFRWRFFHKYLNFHETKYFTW